MLRIFGYLVVNIAVLSFLSWLIPSFNISDWLAAVIFVAILTLLNWTVIPVIKFFTIPVNFITLGLMNALINLVAIIITVRIMSPSITIEGGLGTEVFVAFAISIGLSIAYSIVNFVFKK